jgi:hypothetical protein
MSSAGLYQINLIVPSGLGAGDVPITAWVGQVTTQKNILFSLAGGAFQGCVYTGDGDGDGDGGIGIGDGGYGDGGDGDGGGDGGDGGDGGGGGDGGDGGDGDGL